MDGNFGLDGSWSSLPGLLLGDLGPVLVVAC